MNSICQGCFRQFEDESLLGETLCSSCSEKIGFLEEIYKEITTSKEKQSNTNSYMAAMAIVDLLEDYGFTTDVPIDPVELKTEISETIQYYMKGTE